MRFPALSPALAAGLVPSLALVVALGAASGCAKPAAISGERPAAAPSRSAEAAATHELEDKAAGYEERFREIQESDMSAEEKAQAAGELVDEQQRTIREAAEGTGGAAATGESEPEPQE